MTALLPTPTPLAEHVAAIRRLYKCAIGDIIEIGRRLTECQGIVGHGHWHDWLKAEFGWSDSSALNFMRVYDISKSANFVDLGIPISALYLLAAPGTPEEVRTEIFERAKAGETVSVARVKNAIADAKAEAEIEAEPEAPAHDDDGEDGDDASEQHDGDGDADEEPSPQGAKAVKAARIIHGHLLPSNLPKPTEANALAKKTGKAQLASDGNFYFGTSPEEAQAGEDRRTIVYGIRHAAETLASIKLSPENFIKYALPHQLWDEEEEAELGLAETWLARLCEVWGVTVPPARVAAPHSPEQIGEYLEQLGDGFFSALQYAPTLKAAIEQRARQPASANDIPRDKIIEQADKGRALLNHRATTNIEATIKCLAAIRACCAERVSAKVVVEEKRSGLDGDAFRKGMCLPEGEEPAQPAEPIPTNLTITPSLDRRPAPQTLIDGKPPVEEKPVEEKPPVDPAQPTDQSKVFTAVERAVEVATRH